MKSKTILVLAISFAFILGTMIAGSEGAFAAKDDAKKTEKKEKKVIILYKSDETDKKDDKGKKHKDKEKHVEKLKEKNAKIKYVYDIIPGIAATIDEDSIIDLMNDEDVLAVVDDVEVYAHLQFSIPQINADDVHAAGITGAGVNVCIVDTGVDDSHPALNSVIAEYDFINNDSDATDDHYHGTHVAGIVASIDSTYKGVAPGASLMAAKVLGSTGSGTISSVIQGIDWCVANGADIITMSLGYGLFAGTCDTLDAIASNNAVAAGVVVIASSGNNGSTNGMGSPSCGSDVISVGAVSQTDVRAGFSNGSTELDVVAPGVSIQSLNLGGSGYRTLSGTSMAAPHVAGTVALMLEKNSELTPDEIRTILHESSVDLGSPGFDNLYGYGRINAQAAVDMDFETPPIPPIPPIPPLPIQNLFVSAENSLFDNYMSGPQVIEIVIIDSDINDTDEARGEPDVTVNGKELRMVQAVDGNWYAYFADRIMAETADTTSVIAGEGLDFGTFCDPDVTIGGSITGGAVSFDDTAGVAFPLAVGSGSGSTDNTVPGFGSCNVNISGVTTIPNNVVREAKEPNPSFIDPDSGPVGVGQIDIDVNAWPFIQLINLNPTGNVVVQYNKGGGAQSTTLTFDTVDQYATAELDRPTYPQNSQVHVTISDLWLNIDPTDEDSWTFGTASYPYGNPSTNYQVFDEDGFAVGDTPTNTDDNLLTAALPYLMCEDNCILLINTNAQNAPNPVLTLSDNNDSEIIGTNSNDALSFRTAGGNLDGKIPVTITEQGPNSGIFSTYDESDNSILRITSNGARGTSATIDYNETPITILRADGWADVQINPTDDEWNSGEEILVVITDTDLNKNSRADEDLDLFDTNVQFIPSLSTGDPFTLGEAGVDFNPLRQRTLATATYFDNSNGFLIHDSVLVGTPTTIATTLFVQQFSDRAMISSFAPAFTYDTLVFDLKTNAEDLKSTVLDKDTLRGFSLFNIDVRSLSNSCPCNIWLLSDVAGTAIVTEGTGALSSTLFSHKILVGVDAQSLSILPSDVVDYIQTIPDDNQIGIAIEASSPVVGVNAKDAVVADFFSFGFLDDGVQASERVSNQIIRIEVEESGDNTSRFEASLEFIMINQLNILDESTYTSLNPISDEPTFIVIEDLTDEDSPRVTIVDLGADGVISFISDQEEAPSHSGVVSFNADSYKIFDTVKVTLEDLDLNVDSDLIEIYTVVTLGPSADVDNDQVGNDVAPPLDTLSFGSLGRLLDITFDDDKWTDEDACTPDFDDGLGATGFTLIETDVASGVFVGEFEIPLNWCRPDGSAATVGIPETTPGLDIEVNYVDYRDASGEIIEIGDSAGIRANTGSVSLDRTVYPVPFGNVDDFFPGQLESDNEFPDGDSLFPVHLTGVTADGDQNIDAITEEITPGDLIIYARIIDPDFDSKWNVLDTIATGQHGPIEFKISRGAETILLATAGGVAPIPGVITNGAEFIPGVTRELGPITELAPDAGVFEIALPVRYTDGPASNSCPSTPDAGYESLNGNTGVLGRFDVAPSSGSYCILSGDLIFVEYNDPADASGSPNTVVDHATADTQNGVVQTDKSLYIIGADMIFTLIDPDLNLDSDNAESYDLDLIEWDSDAATLSVGDLGGEFDSFDPAPSYLRETGDNTGIFQVVLEIPQTLNGNQVQEGEEITLTVTDWSPSVSTYVGEQSVDASVTIFTETFSIVVMTDLPEYVIGQTLTVSGTVRPVWTSLPITISVTNPNNELVTISQTNPLLDGTYSQEFAISNPLWSELGTYTVDVSYRTASDSTTFGVANGFVLSKNSDFTTDDRTFDSSDILYMLISSNTVDTTNMKKMEYKIEDSERNRLKGTLDFNSDGSFTSSVSLADLNPGTVKVELKLEDNNRNKFNVKENIVISNVEKLTFSWDSVVLLSDFDKWRLKFSGSGALPGETVQVIVRDSPTTSTKINAVADADGSFSSTVDFQLIAWPPGNYETTIVANGQTILDTLILPPITLPLNIADVSVDEDVDIGYATILITWDPSHPAFVGLDKFTFAFKTSDGTAIAGNDYQSTAYTMITNPANGIVGIAVYIIDDTIFESDETLTITLTDPNADDATIDTSTVTIIDNDPQPLPEEFFNLSKNSDFSTEDRTFDSSDILYMLTSSSLVDIDNLKKAEFKIQDSKKVKLQGKLILGADGIFTASVSLADLNAGTAKVELKLEDNNRIKFNVKENITIS